MNSRRRTAYGLGERRIKPRMGLTGTMATYTQIVYHIIFSTKNRIPCLLENKRDDLFRFIWGIVKNRDCHLYRINGMEDHIHILTSLHPRICLSDFVKDIKLGASKWIKENKAFPDFANWQEGYGAFTYSFNDINNIIEYIKNQRQHHAKVSFQHELRVLMSEHGIPIDEKYFR